MTDALIAKYGTSRHGHSIFAPSAAAGWCGTAYTYPERKPGTPGCAAYVLVNATAPDTAGVEAAEGTVAHWLAEQWNKHGEAYAKLLIGSVQTAKAGGNTHSFTIDDTMFDYVGQFVRWCQELPGDHYYEQWVDLSRIMPIPGQGGTADHYVIDGNVLTITDLKYGTGIRVFAERNPQAMLYALGVFYEWDWLYGFQTVRIRICQPRLDVFEVWECSRDELLAFADYAKERAAAAWQENAPRTPSSKACQWCHGVSSCPARMRELDRIVDQTFDDGLDYPVMEFPHEDAAAALPPRVSPDVLCHASLTPISTLTLARTLTLRRHVETWLAQVAAECLRRAETGEAIPGWKLADGRERRVFDNPNKAVAYLETSYMLTPDEHSPRALLSPNAAVKVIRKRTKQPVKAVQKALEPYVSRVAAKRTLVPESDDRPDVFSQVDDAFEGED